MNRNAVLLVVSLSLVVVVPFSRADDPTAKPPEEAKKALAELDKDLKALDAKARKEKAERVEKTVKQLQELQDSYTKKLDEAVAIRDEIKRLKEELLHLSVGGKVLDNPGSLTAYRGKNNEAFYFKVTGTITGSVYGSEVYTDDSNLATAAVHAGALKDGETGIVKVTIVEGQTTYTASTENGVTSSGYGQWHGSYTVEAVKVEKK